MRSLTGCRRLAGLATAGFVIVLSCCGSALAQTNPVVQEDPSAILKAGRAALEDKLYELAQSQFEQYLKKMPGPGREAEEATVLLMRALHEQGKNAEIIAIHKARKGWMDKAGKVDSFTFFNAFALYELGRYDEVVKDLSDFGKDFPSSEYSGQVMRLMSWCYLKTGKTNEAFQTFANFDSSFGTSPEGAANLLEWGKALLASGVAGEAHAILARLVKLPADQATVQDGYYWYGLTLIREKKWDEASAVLMTLAGNIKAREDLRAEALIAVADALNAVSKKDDALDALRRGIELAKNPDVKLRGEFEFARYLVTIGKLDQGVQLLKQCIAKFPTNTLAESSQLKIAGALLDSKKYQDSVDEYQHFLETFTNVTGQAEALAGKGWALTGMGRHAEAASVFLKAYALFTDLQKKEQCLFKVGDAYFGNSQYKLAMETYMRFLKEFPESKLDANALFQVGECIALGDKPAEAETVFRDVSEKYPGTPFAEEALLRIGEIRASQEKWLESIYAFNRVMGTYSNGLLYAQALHGRGVANYQLMRFDEALRDFEGVTNRFPASSVFEHSHYMSGRCAYWLGNDERALLVCRDFIKRFPESAWAPEAMFWMANYEYNEGSYESAEKDFLQFVAKYPASQFADDALFWAGLSASKRKEFIRSIELLSRLAKEYPDSRKMAEGRFAQAEALTELARFPDAILIFDEIIAKYTESPLIMVAWGRKGDCQFSLGAEDKKRYEESIESFRIVASNAGADLDLVIRAEYQIGRCLEKLGRTSEAFQQYYKRVILRYFEDMEKGVHHNEACKVWFARAILNAADITEARKDWRGTVSILERMAKAGAPGSEEARVRIGKIKAEHWWLFYNN